MALRFDSDEGRMESAKNMDSQHEFKYFIYQNYSDEFHRDGNSCIEIITRQT